MVANDVLLRVLEDQERGVTPSLDAYLAAFPGHEATVRREFAASVGSIAEAEEGSCGARVRQLGPFRVGAELGRGGQARVYEAVDTRMDRPVALKVLEPRSGLPLGATLRRFQREAETLARLQHPGICPIYEVGSDGGQVFIALRRLDGVALDRVLAAEPPPNTLGADHAHSRSEGRARLLRVLPWFVDLCEALEVAHRAGVVHRDIKPGNVLLTKAGRPVLLDFGLASVEEGVGAELTASGDVLGTPAYMAPEQILGEPVDQRTDIHAVGVCLVECLTGRRPFEGKSKESLFRAVVAPERPRLARSLRAFGSDVVAVVETSLAREPRHRYETAAALGKDLRALIRGEPVRVRTLPVTTRWARRMKRHPATTLLLAGAAASVLVVSVLVGVLLANWPKVQLGRAEAAREAHEAQLAAAFDALLGGVDAPRAYEHFEGLRWRRPYDVAVIAGYLLAAPRAGRGVDDALGDPVLSNPANTGLSAVRHQILSPTASAPPLPADSRPIDHFLYGVLAALHPEPSREQRRATYEHFRRAVLAAQSPLPMFDVALARAAILLDEEDTARLAERTLAVRWPNDATAVRLRALALAPWDPERALALSPHAMRDPASARAMLEVAWRNDRPLAAVRLARADPCVRTGRAGDDLARGVILGALRAGTGLGSDAPPDEPTRAALRNEALDWLAECSTLVRRESEGRWTDLQRTWASDPEFVEWSSPSGALPPLEAARLRRLLAIPERGDAR